MRLTTIGTPERLIGYVRVSKSDGSQSPTLQRGAPFNDRFRDGFRHGHFAALQGSETVSLSVPH